MRLGVCGIGRWGSIWARVLSEMGVLYWVADTNQERVNDYIFSTEVGLEGYFYTPYAKTIPSDTDGVVIATPPETHADIGISFLEKGIPVLIEKPLCVFSSRAEDIIETARENDTPMMSGHTFLHTPTIQTGLCIAQTRYRAIDRMILSWCQEGVRSGSSIDVFDNLGPHPLSILFSVFPHADFSVEVLDVLYSEQNLVEDAIIRLNGLNRDVEVELHLSHTEPRQRQVTINGDAGSLQMNPSSQHVTWSPYAGEEDFTHTLSVDGPEPLKNEARYFMELINRGGAYLGMGKISVRVLQTINRIKLNVY